MKDYVFSYAVTAIGLASNLVPAITDKQKQIITIAALVIAGVLAICRYIYEQRKQLQEQRKELEKKNADIEMSEKEIKGLRKANKRLKGDVNRISDEADNIQSQLSEAQRRLSDWNRTLNLLRVCRPEASLVEISSLFEKELELQHNITEKYLSGGNNDD